MIELIASPMRRQQSAGGDGKWWSEFGVVFVRAIVTILVLGEEALSYRSVLDSLLSLPTTRAEADDPGVIKRCPVLRALRHSNHLTLSAAQASELRDAAARLLQHFPMIPERTRMGFVSSVLTGLDPLTHGVINETLNGTDDTWSPESVIDRPGVLVIAAPPQLVGPAGLTVSRLIVSTLQQAILARDMTVADHPVLLVLDEAQLTLDAESDLPFMQTARDRRSAMVLATQSVSNLRHAAHGSTDGDAQAVADAILGVSAVRYLTASTDPGNHEYAQKLFTDLPTPKITMGQADGSSDPKGQGGRGHRNTSLSIEHEPDVRPIDIVRLKRGVREGDDHVMQAYVSVSGRIWKQSGRPSLLVEFRQRWRGSAT